MESSGCRRVGGSAGQIRHLGIKCVPRSFGNLFPRLASFDNLLAAFVKARRGKRRKQAVAEFELNLEPELLRLQCELTNGTWHPGPYYSFYVHDQKRRLITAAPFRDRVVHHALLNVLEPVFEPTFISDSYACRVGKGQHRALDRFQHWARGHRYVLCGDVKKFYPSVDHEVLMAILRRRIRDLRVIELCEMILGSGAGILESEYELGWFAGDELFTPLERSRGLPIGNLTSQFFGNVYLNELDHFVREVLRVPYYLRYMDDFAVFSNDPVALAETKSAISLLLARLRLALHRGRTRLWRTGDGVQFLGWRVFPGHRLVRKATAYRFCRHLRRLLGLRRSGLIGRGRLGAALVAWFGHTGHGTTFQLNREVLRRAELLACS